jgi:pilus assembly protein CpaC
MTTTISARALALAATSVMTLLGNPIAVNAADPLPNIPHATKLYSDKASQFLPLGVGKSVVIDLPDDIKDVLVADPKIANAVVRTSRRAYIIGVALGQTNVYFFDAQGRQIMGLDIAVTRDLNGIRAAFKRALPGIDVHVEGLADGLMLSGSVASPVESQQAYDLASRLAGDSAKVVNAITVRGRDQVLLKVAVSEVRRDIIKQLGINISGQLTTGQSVVDFVNNNPFPINQPLLSATNNSLSFTHRGVTATLRAMERAGVVRTLAEPNLTAISGESASFLVGGEFPIISSVNCSQVPCQPSVEFKKFGVGLNFTPIVLSDGRISLKVMSEVSELSTEGALSFGGFSVPSLSVRRADTSVEIPSGGSLALAGLIQEQTKQQLNGIPALMNLPVLGALFKSRDFINRQSELVIIVTPFIVRAVAQKDLARPDDGYADASDASTTLLGRFNRIYGAAGKPGPTVKARGNVGFFLD